MATKIVTKNSSTASAVPTAAQLVQGELAVNVADKRLFTEDNGGSIVELGTNPSSLTVSGNIDVDGVTNLDAVDIDGAVDMASTLTVTGEITANGGIALGDNDKATFGASDDLQIYHDGSNSYISDTSGTGDLYLRGSNLRLTDNDGTLFLFGAANADTRLYYSGSSKLATSSTGIDVTGSVTADGLTVDGVAKVLGTAGNTLIIADATETNGYQLKANTSATADFGFLIETLAGKDLLKIEPNNDISFFEDTGTTPKFFWNASAESLGIGTSSPDKLLDVSSNSAPTIRISNTRSDSNWDTDPVFGALEFYSSDVSGSGPSVRASVKAEAFTAFGNATDFVFRNGDSEGVQRENLRIDYLGNVGIGTSSPDKLLTVEGAAAEIAISDTNNTPRLRFRESSTTKASIRTSGGALAFDAGGTTERMRIDSSGNLLVGKTSLVSTTAGFYVLSDGFIAATRDGNRAALLNRLNSDGTLASFQKNNVTVGSIDVTSSATTYNTSSDQRLKENIADADDAGSKIDAIQVRQYDWKADGSHQDYGMIAQELQLVAPEAVSGDAGSEDMMGVDYSKLVPMLIKEIQSLRNRVAQLEE